MTVQPSLRILPTPQQSDNPPFFQLCELRRQKSLPPFSTLHAHTQAGTLYSPGNPRHDLWDCVQGHNAEHEPLSHFTITRNTVYVGLL